MALPSERKNRARQSFEPLDTLDRLIIEELHGDARIRVAELGRRVGLSSPAVADRMRRLEESGVLSFRADVDPRALGYTISAIVRVSPQGRDIPLIPDIARELPEVTECYRITGEDCFFMRLYQRSFDALDPLLDRFTPPARTTTSHLHSAPVPLRPLPVIDAPETDPRHGSRRRASGP
jgi:Lrp/AsnC family leucine-responsive transcriptional regulator